ncbi:hypothetical protein G7Y79_00049g084800 [Physcia stellaris]|nr:hypothetical protein G7Y79_00049g084800 [Physcia stellaris]
MPSPRILYLSILALSTLTAHALPVDQAIRAREDADITDIKKDPLGDQNLELGWIMDNNIVCEGEGCSSESAIKAREDTDTSDVDDETLETLGQAGGVAWSIDPEIFCEGAGCPFNPAVKARDNDNSDGVKAVDKDQIGGVFWEMDRDIICEGEGCPL